MYVKFVRIPKRLIYVVKQRFFKFPRKKSKFASFYTYFYFFLNTFWIFFKLHNDLFLSFLSKNFFKNSIRPKV